ncbi:Gfo/Idh/MocA family protein [Breznakiella homolactica]|uniref:Gfo/Idh/MocA family oxidoreductase n=1 Tax=Breznakiella homolactica TaxID=2798577 RepID=A0A7T7XNA0_9SPIR|nr:Gfo/Idh/MocA family oxidoreductase [Breznakiella homolactica]QQO09373.1 Gfo/Idh/MocA family oxidoreductase [Breznakiella homolactica]
MKRKINAGILGCGQIAQIMHLPYLHDLDGFNIHSLCDISRETVEKVGVKYQVPAEKLFTDCDLFLTDPDLDAVFICSKDHCEPAVKAANAKKHIFVEKPFGFSLAEAEKMADAAEANNVKLMVGYMKRYDTGFDFARNQINNMTNISMVKIHDFGGSFSYTKNVFDVITGSDIPEAVLLEGKEKTNAAMLSEIGGDRKHLLGAYSLLLGVFSHDLVLMRHLFGNEPKILFADVYKNSFTTAVLRFGDIECVLESGLVMKRSIWDESITVYSDLVNLSLVFPWPYLKNAPSKVYICDNAEGTDSPRESVVSASFHEAYRSELMHFYECIVNDSEPITSGRDAVHDIRLAGEIIRAVPV